MFYFLLEHDYSLLLLTQSVLILVLKIDDIALFPRNLKICKT